MSGCSLRWIFYKSHPTVLGSQSRNWVIVTSSWSSIFQIWRRAKLFLWIPVRDKESRQTRSSSELHFDVRQTKSMIESEDFLPGWFSSITINWSPLCQKKNQEASDGIFRSICFLLSVWVHIYNRASLWSGHLLPLPCFLQVSQQMPFNWMKKKQMKFEMCKFFGGDLQFHLWIYLLHSPERNFP